jgi:hypothetical protein
MLINQSVNVNINPFIHTKSDLSLMTTEKGGRPKAINPKNTHLRVSIKTKNLAQSLKYTNEPLDDVLWRGLCLLAQRQKKELGEWMIPREEVINKLLKVQQRQAAHITKLEEIIESNGLTLLLRNNG